MNNVQVIGVVGRDAELRYVADGNPVAETSLAVSKGYKDKKTGEFKEVTDWIPVSAWGKTAERLAEIGRKGAVVLVEGSLKVDQWDDKATGKKQSKMKVLAGRVYKIASTKSADATASQPSQRPPPDVDPSEGF